MDTNRFEQLKRLKEIKNTIQKIDKCEHFWVLFYIEGVYKWYCQKCRKLEEFNAQ